MKKLSFFLVLMIFVLSACVDPRKTAVEQNVLSNEATLPASPTLEPTQGPTAEPTVNPNQHLSVQYQYEGLSDRFVTEKVTSETIIFHLKDGKFSEETIKPKFLKNIPLIGIGASQIAIFGSKGINIKGTQDGITLQPVDNLESEAGVTYMFSISNCEKEYSNPLICRVDGGNGFLNFSLDFEQNTFQYSYSGVWDFRYSEWIDTTLTTLGYKSVKTDLTMTTVEGGKYTINLIKK